MPAAIEINNAVGMHVLINDVYGAVVLEDLKRRADVSRARHAGLKASGFWIGRRAIGEILFLSGKCPRAIGDFASRRIDNHVRTFEAGVGVFLCHPDAPQIRGAGAGGSEENGENETAAEVTSSRRPDSESHFAPLRCSRIQSAPCLSAPEPVEDAASTALNTWLDRQRAPHRRWCP